MTNRQKRIGRVNKTALREDLRSGSMLKKDIAEKHRCARSYVTALHKEMLLNEPVAEPESMKKLTLSQKKFTILKFEGRSNIDAAQEAFGVTTRDSAKSMASREMKNPLVQASLSELLDLHGLSKDSRIGQLKKLVFNQDGHLSLKALDMTFRLDGSLQKGGGSETEVHHHPINIACFINHPDDRARYLKERAEKGIIDVSPVLPDTTKNND